ncbi:MAG: sugar phosphate isomerase/epimerase [Bacteroidales bacterium]
MINRRIFLQNSLLAATGLALLPGCLFSSGPEPERKWGIQLYSLREQLDNGMPLPELLGKLKETGFSFIETASYSQRRFYGYSPGEFRQMVGEAGLSAVSAHINLENENLTEVAEDALMAGMSYIVQPFLPQQFRTSPEQYRQAAEWLNNTGEELKKSGLTFAYHNHDFEFHEIEGEVPYLLLLTHTAPEFVTMQMDTYWVVYGGSEPRYWIHEFPGRFRLIHVKDMVSGPGRESVTPGTGRIDFGELFRLAEKAGVREWIIEQEAFSGNPFESLKEGLNLLNQL